MLQRDIFIIVDVNKGKKCENVLNFFFKIWRERERAVKKKIERVKTIIS